MRIWNYIFLYVRLDVQFINNLDKELKISVKEGTNYVSRRIHFKDVDFKQYEIPTIDTTSMCLQIRFLVYVSIQFFSQLYSNIKETKNRQVDARQWRYLPFGLFAEDAVLGSFFKQGGVRTTCLACFRDHILLQSL